MAVQDAAGAFTLAEEFAVNHVHVEDICDEAGHTQTLADEKMTPPLGKPEGDFLCVNVLRRGKVCRFCFS